MIQKFSKKTIEKLKSYVYVYSDPDTNEPFYIGKGKGNRVFDHLNEKSETDKVKKIESLRKQGKEPKIDLLVYGVDDDMAKKIEAAAIDLIGIKNLTNINKGYESLKYGRVSVELLESKYSNKDELQLQDIKDNIIMFKIRNTYRNGMTTHEIYDITRSAWKVTLKEAKKYNYALSIYDGVVLEVFEILEWFKGGGSTLNSVFKNEYKNDERYEFVGRVANDKVRKRYINKSVKKLYNAQKEFRYLSPLNNNKKDD